MRLPWQRYICRSKYGCFCISPKVTYLHTKIEEGLKFFISNFASLSWRIALKEPLRKVLGRTLLSFSELNTLLIKIEGVIKSRPLTAVSDDNRDPLPITPAHLAIGRSLKQLLDAEDDQLEDSSKRIMERYLYLQRVLNHYWRRWKQEYFYQLIVRNKRQKETAPIQVGDIVLVSEDNVSRGKWPLGRVEKVHLGKDGLVRAATLRVQKSILTKPVQRLHRLEIESATLQTSQEEEVPLHGGEKLQSNVFPAQSVPVSVRLPVHV